MAATISCSAVMAPMAARQVAFKPASKTAVAAPKVANMQSAASFQVWKAVDNKVSSYARFFASPCTHPCRAPMPSGAAARLCPAAIARHY